MSSPAETLRELHMGFTVAEVAQGIERLLRELDFGDPKESDESGARFRAPGGVTIDVEPMPRDRIVHPVLFPRTLVTLRGDSGAIAALERKILLAFLRVGG